MSRKNVSWILKVSMVFILLGFLGKKTKAEVAQPVASFAQQQLR
jgi:hypothetical protein